MDEGSVQPGQVCRLSQGILQFCISNFPKNDCDISCVGVHWGRSQINKCNQMMKDNIFIFHYLYKASLYRRLKIIKMTFLHGVPWKSHAHLGQCQLHGSYVLNWFFWHPLQVSLFSLMAALLWSHLLVNITTLHMCSISVNVPVFSGFTHSIFFALYYQQQKMMYNNVCWTIKALQFNMYLSLFQ